MNLLFQRFLLVNALLVVFVQQSAFAKQVKVRINAEQGAKEIAKSVAARLQGTERYAVTESDDAELYLLWFAKWLCLTLKGFLPTWRELFGLGLQADSTTGEKYSQRTWTVP